ncbi:MAG: hypothetical protein JST06_01560 [Bacteroidetes bacterium]|nr:hypothetical protein [Bacteroidota bacterium]MBS1630611.1 hypothetical protein [Bacteroidota bacterium]
MKSNILILFLALCTTSGLRAQNIDVINNTSCAVLVTLRAFESKVNLCKVAGGTNPLYSAPYSTSTYGQSSWVPPPPGYPYSYSGKGYAWGYANVGITNPSPGYEYSVSVGDPAVSCDPTLSFSAPPWYNPTCGMNMNVSFVPGSGSSNAQVIINP